MKDQYTYEELVKTARAIMVQIECHQAMIAKLALEACDIQRGGDHGTRKYSLIDFANDANIEHGSLKHWVSVYRDVFVKLDIPNPTKDEWQKGQRTHAALRSVVDDKTAKGRGYKAALPKATVQKLYHDVSTNPEQSLAADKALGYAIMIQSLLKKVDLSTQSPALLSQIANTLIPITTKVTEHLTKTKGRSA